MQTGGIISSWVWGNSLHVLAVPCVGYSLRNDQSRWSMVSLNILLGTAGLAISIRPVNNDVYGTPYAAKLQPLPSNIRPGACLRFRSEGFRYLRCHIADSYRKYVRTKFSLSMLTEIQARFQRHAPPDIKARKKRHNWILHSIRYRNVLELNILSYRKWCAICISCISHTLGSRRMAAWGVTRHVDDMRWRRFFDIWKNRRIFVGKIKNMITDSTLCCYWNDVGARIQDEAVSSKAAHAIGVSVSFKCANLHASLPRLDHKLHAKFIIPYDTYCAVW